MNKLELFKASGFRDKEVPSLVILFEKEIPTYKDLKTSRDAFSKQGKSLANALISHLPGGLVDSLLAHLLQNRASLLHVPGLLPEQHSR